MADQGAPGPENITPETSNTTPGQDTPDLATTTPPSIATSTTPAQDPDPPGPSSTRSRIDITTMTEQERLDFVNTLPITSSVMSTQTAWPASGGVWVLDPTEAQVQELEKYTVTDMEEYCRVLEAVGATFYSDPMQHEGTRVVLEDIRAYEAQLKAEAEAEAEDERERGRGV
ncbi:hypothetical protein BJY00DRAFT_284099 [Aspergillus carlsbadensis]|nr:hypothetical protein BJY00DRAFT_284099 [Aspergillus carlsbadensis]